MTILARYSSALTLLVSLVACGEQSAPEDIAVEQEQRMLRRVITHEGITREYFVHIPTHVDGPMPVVLAIHGYTSTATGF